MSATEINTKFYQDIFSVWNNDPHYYWSGFWLLYSYLDICFANKKEIKVLDVGCANGRFFNFLEFCFPEKKFIKIGLDFVDFPVVNEFEFIKIDITSQEFQNLEIGSFDLVTMFGVYHHIQGAKVRQEITNKISKFLKKESLFIFTRWNFLMLDRLRRHILKPHELDNYNIKLDLLKLEMGDYYLKWDKNKEGVRFANIMDVYEIESMLKQANMSCKESYNCDDKNENRNTYFVCNLI
jgi:SAM-dependent methyltransferase